MRTALADFQIEGVATTIPAHLRLLDEPTLLAGEHTTRTVEDGDALASLAEESSPKDVLLVDGRPVRLWNPAMAPSAAAAVHAGPEGTGELQAPMQGTILKVLVEEGQTVSSGDPV